MRAKIRLIWRPSYYVYKDMIEDIFQVLMSHPALISSDISQLRLIMISQEINSLEYNNHQCSAKVYFTYISFQFNKG